MTCWAIVPVKPRRAGKTRLAGMLGDEERLELVRAMLRHVLDTAIGVMGPERVIVMSNERDQIPSMIPVAADSASDLNASLAGLRARLAERGARELIILPADLPLLRAEDIERLIAAGREAGCAIAPDRWGTGTNGLALAGALPFAFRFGPDSFAAHVAVAQGLGLDAARVDSPSLACDVDGEDDLRELDALIEREAVAGSRWR